jgi:hypothetical protein
MLARILFSAVFSPVKKIPCEAGKAPFFVYKPQPLDRLNSAYKRIGG